MDLTKAAPQATKAAPRHIGIIMDGNGRWAARQNLPRPLGHKAGVQTFRRICDYAAELGLECLTFYAFSTENWQRSSVEVAAIMNLFREQLDDLERRQAENERKGFRIRFIGDLQDGGPVPGDILRRLRAMEASSSSKTKTTVNVALNYGGRAEILRAAQQLARRCMEGALQPEQFTESLFEAQLATAGLPPLDLIIRPSGELRLSNFLLWQSAYAEFWFSNVLWPDFSCADLDAALAAFGKRSRRYGNSESLGKMV